MPDVAERNWTADLQRSVGCPHSWVQIGNEVDGCTPVKCKRCAMRGVDTHHSTLPFPAPDCSTLRGALVAAGRKIVIWVQTDKDGTLLLKDDNDDDWTCCVTEADACSFIARKYVEFTEREDAR